MKESCDQGAILCRRASDAFHQIPDHKPPPLDPAVHDTGTDGGHSANIILELEYYLSFLNNTEKFK